MRFSIVIPSYRRPELLRNALAGVAALVYSRDDFEVLVVDDGAADGTVSGVAAAVLDYATKLDVHYIARPVRQGPAAARNAGAERATGKFLAFLDDDCVPDSHWLARLDEALCRCDDAAVAFGGRTLCAPGASVFGIASQSLVDFLYAWYNVDGSDARFFATNNFACRREDFLAIGGFDSAFQGAAAEDRDFCDRWIERGWRMQFVDQAIVYHVQRATLLEFLRQQSGYGRGAVDLHHARDRRGVARPRLEPLRFYLRLLTHGARHGALPRRFVMLVLALASQVAYAWGYYTELLRRPAPASHARDVTDVARPSPER